MFLWAEGNHFLHVFKYSEQNFYHCTVHFEIYIVHSPTNALFINFIKSFKFTLKFTIITLVHVSVFNDHRQGLYLYLNKLIYMLKH